MCTLLSCIANTPLCPFTVALLLLYILASWTQFTLVQRTVKQSHKQYKVTHRQIYTSRPDEINNNNNGEPCSRGPVPFHLASEKDTKLNHRCGAWAPPEIHTVCDVGGPAVTRNNKGKLPVMHFLSEMQWVHGRSSCTVLCRECGQGCEGLQNLVGVRSQIVATFQDLEKNNKYFVHKILRLCWEFTTYSLIRRVINSLLSHCPDTINIAWHLL